MTIDGSASEVIFTFTVVNAKTRAQRTSRSTQWYEAVREDDAVVQVRPVGDEQFCCFAMG